jgi:hypothetical protein
MYECMNWLKAAAVSDAKDSLMEFGSWRINCFNSAVVAGIVFG